MVDMARDTGRIAPGSFPAESSHRLVHDDKALQTLQTQCRDKDARIVFLEDRLKEVGINRV